MRSHLGGPPSQSLRGFATFSGHSQKEPEHVKNVKKRIREKRKTKWSPPEEICSPSGYFIISGAGGRKKRNNGL